MGESESMTEFVEGLLAEAPDREGGLGRQTVKVLPQPGEGDESGGAAKLRLAVKEGQDRVEEVGFGERQDFRGAGWTRGRDIAENARRVMLTARGLPCLGRKRKLRTGTHVDPQRFVERGDQFREDGGLDGSDHGQGEEPHTLLSEAAGPAMAAIPAGATGIATVKVAPWPAVLAAEISPPCS